jgi:hypothetical protein
VPNISSVLRKVFLENQITIKTEASPRDEYDLNIQLMGKRKKGEEKRKEGKKRGGKRGHEGKRESKWKRKNER